MSDNNTVPRNLPRSVAAVLAGFIAVFVLSLSTDQIMHALDVYPPWGEPMSGTGFMLTLAGGIAMWDKGAHWYPIALALSALPCAWYGATLHLERGDGHVVTARTG